MVEIYQNCNVFNDGAFFTFTEKDSKMGNTLWLEDGEPLIFGANNEFGIKLDGFQPVIVDMANGGSPDDLWVHDKSDRLKASILTRMFHDPKETGSFPRPFGVFYQQDRYRYEDQFIDQIKQATEKNGEGDLDALLRGTNTWTIK